MLSWVFEKRNSSDKLGAKSGSGSVQTINEKVDLAQSEASVDIDGDSALGTARSGMEILVNGSVPGHQSLSNNASPRPNQRLIIQNSSPGMGFRSPIDGVSVASSRASSPGSSLLDVNRSKKELRRGQSEIQLQKAKEEHGKMKDRHSMMRDHVHGIAASLATLKQENADLRESEQKLQVAHMDLQQQVQQYQTGEISTGMTAKEKGELRELRESEQRLQARLQAANSEIQLQLQQLETSEQRIGSLKADNSEQRENVLKWQAANTKLQQNVLEHQKKEQSLAALKPENAELKERVQKLEASNTAFQQQVAQLRISHQATRDDLQRQAEELQTREKNLAAVKLENADLRESEQRLLASSIDQQHQYQLVQTSEQKMKVERDDMQGRMQAYIEETDGRITNFRVNEEKLKKSNDDLNQRLKMSNEELNEKMHQLQASNEDMTNKLQVLTEDVEKKSARILELESNEVLLKESNQDAHKRLEVYDDKMRDCSGSGCNQQ